MKLSKSKYCNGVQCYKMLWLDKNKPEEKIDVSNDSVLDNGSYVGEYAKRLFGEYIDIEFNDNLNVMISDTNKALEKDNVVITEASFNYNDNFCSVDILKKNGNKYEIYEVKSSTEVKDIYLDDISYQVYVLKSLGLDVVKANIVYINSNYVRYGDLDLNKLFIIKDVSSIVFSKLDEVINRINSINKYMEQVDEPDMDLDMYCFNPYECPFFKYCSRHLPENNVFNIRQMRNSTKFKLYKEGLFSYESLLNSDINDKYKRQIDFELNNKDDYINIDNINKFIDSLSYPLYFLDFETYQQSIPQYDGVRPYMQIPFQYSLHYILEENGVLEHKEFLAESGIDPRRSLALQLVNDIPKDVCTIAYNMRFEKMVLKDLANLYPDLSGHLMNIHDNMVDLMIPFRDGDYYSKDMHGSFSIKYVLPALFMNDESLNYHNLDEIHNGSEAMNAYANMEELNEEDRLRVRHNLLKYCELDTYAMVKIWEKLKELQ